MHTSDRSRFSLVLSVCLSTSLAACGADLDTPAMPESASALVASSTYLVSFAGGQIPANAATIVGAAGGTIVARYTNVGLVLAKTTSSKFATTLRADARVSSVGASKTVSSSIDIVKANKMAAHPVEPQRAPGPDPLSNRQWDMDQIRSQQARAISIGKKSVLVGVLDSGIDVTHPDLAGQVNLAASASCIGGIANTDASVWANDIIGHGTHVAGTIAGAKNGVGIVGVAPGVTLAAVKLAVDDFNDPNFGLVFADALVCAIDWSIGHGFDLMNASLTVDPSTGPIDDIFCTDQPDRAAIIKMVGQAVLAAGAKNATLVASMGNFFLDLARRVHAEAGLLRRLRRGRHRPHGAGRRLIHPGPAREGHDGLGPGAVERAAGQPLLSDLGRLERPGAGLLIGHLLDVRVHPGRVTGGPSRHGRRRAGDQPLRQDVARDAPRRPQPHGQPAPLPALTLRSRHDGHAGDVHGDDVLQQFLRRGRGGRAGRRSLVTATRWRRPRAGATAQPARPPSRPRRSGSRRARCPGCGA